jgi:lactate permease
MDSILGVILIIFPIVLAFVLLVFMHKPADVTGVIVWFITLIIAILAFQTDIMVALIASIAGIVKSFPISLMVATSILMMTYMQETGALQRLIIFFKTLGGGSRPIQILIISLGLGLFLVGIGATPVTMLPPVMLALGFSPLVAVALPSIGYDPLTTFALLGVPVDVFQLYYHDATGIALTPAQAGSAFAIFMPIITVGIAISMLWIAGGRKLLMNREGLILAMICGVTAGLTAIFCNLDFIGLTRLTNVIAGAFVLLVIFIYTRVRGRKLIDKEQLSDEDRGIEKSISLVRASIPWTILVVLSLVTTLIEPVKVFLSHDLDFVVRFGQILQGSQVVSYSVSTKFLWQAYTLMLIATLLSIPFLSRDKQVLRKTMRVFLKRAPRPVLAAAIFFAMAEVMNYSGFFINAVQIIVPPMDPFNNMIFLLATMTAGLGILYPIFAPFLGLLAGFVSGSETSAIAMFTRYHVDTSTLIGANALAVSASNGVGGGLASVLSPAKIQNAAAVIDEIGIEGKVIRYGLVVALLMTWATAILTMLQAFALTLTLIIIVGAMTLGPLVVGISLYLRGRNSADTGE